MSSEIQTAKMLRLLRQAGQRGVENFVFPQFGILRYSARLDDLRKEGYNIITERVKLNGRSTGVFKYILIEEDK